MTIARALGAIPLLVAPLGLLALSACDGLLDAGPASPGGPRPDHGSCVTCVGGSRLPRLTRLEYERSLRAALGAEVADGLRYDYLPGDGRAGPFASNSHLDVDDDAVEAYRTVAERAGARAGEIATADPARVIGCTDAAPSTACVTAFVDRLATALFRRSISAGDRAPYVTLFDSARAAGTASDGARMVVTAMLQSPLFLYRIEIGTPTDDPSVLRLTGEEIASRLAAFLWRSAPDDVLLAAAARGDLGTDEGLEREARRMALDPRADVAIARFHTSWLGMESMSTLTHDAYPELEALRDDMYRETADFAVHVFREDDARLSTLLTARYTIASAELATLYGGSRDSAGIVTASASERAGILTHAGFLASHTPSPSTAGIYRGRVIREGFLCQSMPHPPPIDTVIAPDPTLSARQQLEQKTSAATCQACHQLMNPAGFLFEHYDGLGRFRTMDGMFPIDATGELVQSDIDGEIDGALELADALAASEQVDRCVARQWMRFALGRLEIDDDERSLELAYQRYVESDRDLRELLVALALTDSFRHRRLPLD